MLVKLFLRRFERFRPPLVATYVKAQQCHNIILVAINQVGIVLLHRDNVTFGNVFQKINIYSNIYVLNTIYCT